MHNINCFFQLMKALWLDKTSYQNEQVSDKNNAPPNHDLMRAYIHASLRRKTAPTCFVFEVWVFPSFCLTNFLHSGACSCSVCYLLMDPEFIQNKKTAATILQ